MGKTRRSNFRKVQSNPLAKPSHRDEEIADDENIESPIANLMEQLQSPNDEDKMNAMQNIAVLSLSNEKVKMICEGEIIRIMAPFLVDHNESIRNATAGALRNLSVHGVDICEILVEQDVLTPLIALLHQYAVTPDWVPTFDKSLRNQLNCKSDTFLQAVNLLWNLCESTSVALDTFNQSQLLESFIRCLDYNIFGSDIAMAVAQCILVVSEDNSLSWTVLNKFVPEFNCLLSIDTENDSKLILLRTLTAGILSNVPALAAAHSIAILSALAKTLDVNHRIILGQITSKLPLDDELGEEDPKIIDDSNLMEDETQENANLRRRRMDLPSENELEIENVGYILMAQRVAAEIISNQCSPDDEEWDENDDNLSEEETVHDYDASNHSSTNNLNNLDKLPVEILEAVKTLGLIEKLWQRAQPIPENVLGILEESSPPLFQKLNNLRISTFLCLQNLCNGMSTEDLGGPNVIYNVWLDVGQQVFQGTSDSLILEPATSLMRAALEHLRKSSDLFQQMTENDIELMLNGVQNCKAPEIRANLLRMLGILGCLLPEPLMKIILSFILETCSKEHDVWTISEAVDSVMDIFSDNDWNEIALELNLLQKSRELDKIMKNKMRQQKNSLKDRYPAVMTVRQNLQRFTKYIEIELKKYTQQQNV